MYIYTYTEVCIHIIYTGAYCTHEYVVTKILVLTDNTTYIITVGTYVLYVNNIIYIYIYIYVYIHYMREMLRTYIGV